MGDRPRAPGQRPEGQRPGVPEACAPAQLGLGSARLCLSERGVLQGGLRVPARGGCFLSDVTAQKPVRGGLPWGASGQPFPGVDTQGLCSHMGGWPDRGCWRDRAWGSGSPDFRGMGEAWMGCPTQKPQRQRPPLPGSEQTGLGSVAQGLWSAGSCLGTEALCSLPGWPELPGGRRAGAQPTYVGGPEPTLARPSAQARSAQPLLSWGSALPVPVSPCHPAAASSPSHVRPLRHPGPSAPSALSPAPPAPSAPAPAPGGWD